MKRTIIQSLLMASTILALAMNASDVTAQTLGKVSIKLPKETTQFMRGPGVEAAKNNCVRCHSADYIYMQPPLTKDQWLGEVTKMKKTYGAPIDDADIDGIVNYLMSQNGKAQ